MRKILTLILLLLIPYLTVAQDIGGNYYVAPDGDDNGSGTYAEPWATFQKAINTAVAGDTVYFRGGIYYEDGDITYNPNRGIGSNGANGIYVCYFNYPGESPIFDWSQYNEEDWFNTGLEGQHLNLIHFRGLEFRNILQRYGDSNTLAAGVLAQGIICIQSYNLTFENMVIHNVGGRAVSLSSGLDQHPEVAYDTTIFLNCDFYDLCDSVCMSTDQEVCNTSSVGGISDGIKVDNYGGQYVLIQGCRIWHHGDNGIDVSSSARYEIKNCWVFRGGDFEFTEASGPYAGEGSGIKYGSILPYANQVTRVINNNISAFNLSFGFDESNSGSYYYMLKGEIYNNTSYKNYYGLGTSVGKLIQL